MSIKVTQDIDQEILKKGCRSAGVFICVDVNGNKSAVILHVKKVPKMYHRLIIDIDKTGLKVSDSGRKELKKLIDFYGKPDVREPKRSFTNTYVLDVEVQRGDDTFEGELRILDQLFLLLEKRENTEQQAR